MGYEFVFQLAYFAIFDQFLVYESFHGARLITTSLNEVVIVANVTPYMKLQYIRGRKLTELTFSIPQWSCSILE